jgi:signal transduction histidine kinase
VLQDEVFGPLSGEQHEMLANVVTGADRMLVMVNNLLDISRMAAGGLGLSVGPCAYHDVVAEVARTLSPLASSKGQRLEVLPCLSTVHADPVRVVQILTNLIDNAIKFTPEGGEIRIRSTLDSGVLRTEVRDTGPGIADDDLPRLFKRFQQLDMSLERRAGGAGLGLSIAKALVEAHGGTIGVESALGQGSCFWFTLPQSPVSTAALEVQLS